MTTRETARLHTKGKWAIIITRGGNRVLERQRIGWQVSCWHRMLSGVYDSKSKQVWEGSECAHLLFNIVHSLCIDSIVVFTSLIELSLLRSSSRSFSLCLSGCCAPSVKPIQKKTLNHTVKTLTQASTHVTQSRIGYRHDFVGLVLTIMSRACSQRSSFSFQ
jgi:hypothetical protein